jgi:hypothetical protein
MTFALQNKRVKRRRLLRDQPTVRSDPADGRSVTRIAMPSPAAIAASGPHARCGPLALTFWRAHD